MKIYCKIGHLFMIQNQRKINDAANNEYSDWFGYRCELKHVNGSLSLNSVIISIGAVIIVLLILMMVFMGNKLRRMEIIMRLSDKNIKNELSAQKKLLSQKLNSQNGTKRFTNVCQNNIHDKLELTRIHQQQQQQIQHQKQQLSKSASSPVVVLNSNAGI